MDGTGLVLKFEVEDAGGEGGGEQHGRPRVGCA